MNGNVWHQWKLLYSDCFLQAYSLPTAYDIMYLHTVITHHCFYKATTEANHFFLFSKKIESRQMPPLLVCEASPHMGVALCSPVRKGERRERNNKKKSIREILGCIALPLSLPNRADDLIIYYPCLT